MDSAKTIIGYTIEYVDNEQKVVNNSDAIMILTERNLYRNLDLEMAKKPMKCNIILGLGARNLLRLERSRTCFYL